MSADELDLATLARSSASQPFWAGLQEQRLLLPWCTDCEAPFFPPRRFCPRCRGSSIEWRPSRGTGTVWAHSSVVTAFDPQLPVPYVALLVDLDDGSRIAGMLDDPSGTVAVGDRVELVWPEKAPARLPAWRHARE